MNTVDIQISHLENNSEINNRNHDITISRIKNKLKVLAEQFVFLPADKAANNVVVV